MKLARAKASIPDLAKSEKLIVFVSYSRADLDIANALVAALDDKFNVVIDRRNLPYGEEWQAELADFIRSSDTVVWLVSPESVSSKWCNWELGEVTRLKKRLVPVTVRGIDPAALPEALGKIQLLPAAGTFSIEQDLADLVETLETDRAWLKDATRLAEDAYQWIGKGHDSALLLRGRALADAEKWSSQRPKAALSPPAEALELILASRKRAGQRRNWWIASGFVGFTIVTQILALSLFFRNDASLNEARYALQDGQVQSAQRKFEDLLSNPISRLLPTSASARALATQFLNTATLHDLAAFPASRQNAPGRGELLIAGGRLYGISDDGQAKTVFRCESSGAACTQRDLETSWKAPALVHDGADAFMVDYDLESTQSRIAKIAAEGPLAIESKALESGEYPQFSKTKGGDRVWVGSDYSRNLSSRNKMFSEQPPLSMDKEMASLAPLVDLRAPTSSQSSGENQNKADSEAPLELDQVAKCSDQFQVCLLSSVDFEADARGTIMQFDLWARDLSVLAPAEKPPPAAIRPTDRQAKVKSSQKPATADASPSTSHRFVQQVDKLFYPLPSRNEMAVSFDGQWIAISEEKTLHLWRTSEVSLLDRKPAKSLQLSEVIQSVLFDRTSNDLIVLTSSALRKVRHQPRATAVSEARETERLSLRNLSDKSDQTDTKPHNIGVIKKSLQIFREDDGRLTSAVIGGGKAQTFFTPPSGKTIAPRVWEDQGFVSVSDSTAGTTQLIQLSSEGKRLLSARFPGLPVFIDSEARLAVLAGKGCLYRVVVFPAYSRELKPFSNLSECDPSEGDFHVLGDSHSNYALAITAPNAEGSDNLTNAGLPIKPYKITRPSPDNTDISPFLAADDLRDSSVNWNDRAMTVFDGKDSVVKISGGEDLRVEHLRVSEDSIQELFRASYKAGTFQLLPITASQYIAFLDSADCQPSTGQYKEYFYGTLALLSRRDDRLLTEFLLKCVARFPDKPVGHNADVAIEKTDDGRIFFGAYTFDGVFDWKPSSGSLRLYQFSLEGEDGKLEERELKVGTYGANQTKYIDLRTRGKLSDGPGATVMHYSKAANRLAFFQVAEGSAGHSKNVQIADFSSMTIRSTPNRMKNFFDNITAAQFSPNGKMILTSKQDSGTHEIFRVSDLQRIGLPDSIAEIGFDGDQALSIKLKNGARLRWRIPESDEGEVEYLRTLINGSSKIP
jgi:WD40 repeat protein